MLMLIAQGLTTVRTASIERSAGTSVAFAGHQATEGELHETSVFGTELIRLS